MKMYEKRNEEEFKGRISFVIVIVVILFTIILSRLWYLQLIHGKKFKSLSENNRIRIQNIAAPRGLIFDRKGRILVDNYPSFSLSLIPEDVNDLDSIVKRLGKLLGFETASVIDALNNVKDATFFKQIELRSDLDRSDVALFETHKLDLPGLSMQIRPKRFYLHNDTASHIIGHMGKISKFQLKKMAYAGYNISSLIGKYGIESEYERFLRGKDGGCQVEVDASGRELRVLSELVEAEPGGNVFLTIDLDIQGIVEDLLKDKKACAIAMNPNNGEILALASSPSFNPNLFSTGISKIEWEKLVNNPHNPLENKAIQGQYPPASVYKIVTAIAALEEGIITAESTYSCKGFYRFGGRNNRCWKKNGHGTVNLHRAIVESCDVFFYQVGKSLGIDKLSHYSFLFGLGKKTGISLTNEKSGLIPTKEWKKKIFKSRWQKGETLSASIGQGFVLVTPIQIATFISSIANGGILYVPQLINRIESYDGSVIQENPPKKIRSLPFHRENLSLIANYLSGVVNEKGGTGWMARSKDINIAGKTGTAQVVSLSDNGKEYEEKNMPFHLRDHAWFVAFAPAENPKISVVVIIEHGGHGGTAAAPIAKEIIENSIPFLN